MNSNKNLMEILPVLTFIGSYFLFHLFDWMEATQFILATMVSLGTYFVMVSDFKVKNKDTDADFKGLNFYVGLLTLLALIIFLHGFLHWYRMVSFTLRMSVLFGLLLAYMVVLFRALRIFNDLKNMIAQK